jgi:hypothetical protein
MSGTDKDPIINDRKGLGAVPCGRASDVELVGIWSARHGFLCNQRLHIVKARPLMRQDTAPEGTKFIAQGPVHHLKSKSRLAVDRLSYQVDLIIIRSGDRPIIRKLS